MEFWTLTKIEQLNGTSFQDIKTVQFYLTVNLQCKKGIFRKESNTGIEFNNYKVQTVLLPFFENPLFLFA